MSKVTCGLLADVDRDSVTVVYVDAVLIGWLMLWLPLRPLVQIAILLVNYNFVGTRLVFRCFSA